ncbi:glycoside hydrolase family 27 protein [Mycobacterium sp.]|uniref:glycoside hydrolase family 27 protein n=1 Tax=Mycobacterium sp. TaxID=1785 RepID=UPI0039C8C6EA
MRRWAIVALLSSVGAVMSGCGALTNSGAPPRLTPPMGWNSWNSGIAVTEQSVKATIDAMVTSGMRDAGYRYVNLDAGWAAPERDRHGQLQADPVRFPGGMPALARYAHDRGMLFGLYSSPFNQTCGQGPGTASAGHEVTDARTFAAWGVDYLKYDWCRGDADHTDQVRIFSAMRNALRDTGRRILYSINPNSSDDHTAGVDYDWSHTADMTRDTTDVVPVWRPTLPPLGPTDSFLRRTHLGVPDGFAAAGPAAQRSRPGFFNDPDMLVLGLTWSDYFTRHLEANRVKMAHHQLTPHQLDSLRAQLELSPQQVAWRATAQPGLTETEQRTHFSLWAMLAAPLIAGNDLRATSEDTRDILTNGDVVAVDQDPLVTQATTLPQDGRVLVKPLRGGAVAVALFNPDNQPATIATSASAVGLPGAPCYTARDLWTHTDTTTGQITAAAVPAHGATMLRISPTCR